MKRPIPILPLVLLGLLLGSLMIVAGVARLRHDRLVNVGEEILYDDFGFTVQSVEQTRLVGPKGREVRAYGMFWIVDLDIGNHARRVSYQMDSHVPLLVDERGREIPVSGRGQAALETKRDPVFGDDALKPSRIGPGDHLVTPLVFDVPEDAGDVRLKLVFGGSIGEMLDYVFLGNRRFALR